MQNHISRKKRFFVFMLAVILVMAGLMANRAYKNYLLTQKLKKEEIYMFRDTYYFSESVTDDVTIYAYYMVCEPVDSKIQLVEKLERLMIEKKIVQGAKEEYQKEYSERYRYDDPRISVEFYRPSREFPIGWQPVGNLSMQDYQEISENLLLSIDVPWDAKSEDDHTYYFWWKDRVMEDMKFDVYIRRTLEDGSFILIPKK